MANRRRTGFFDRTNRPEDSAARLQDVEALISPRRSVLQDLPIERIRPNPYQARTQFDDLDELANTIRMHGFITRLRVRPDPTHSGYFQLVFGERRLRAAAMVGLEAIPCEVAEHTDAELIEIGLAENIQRKSLSPLEEAQAFVQLMQQQDYTIRSLAERIGKNKSYVEDRIKLLSVPEDVLAMVRLKPDTLRSAREIAKLPESYQRAPLIDAVLDGTMSTTDIRREIRAALLSQERTSDLLGDLSWAHTDQVGNMRKVVLHDVMVVEVIVRRWGDLLSENGESAPLVAKGVEQIEGLLGQLRERLIRHG